MRDYEAEARAAELKGRAKAARIRAGGLEKQAAYARGDHLREAARKREKAAHISREVAAGRMCPGGCDTYSGGCRLHADSC